MGLAKGHGFRESPESDGRASCARRRIARQEASLGRRGFAAPPSAGCFFTMGCLLLPSGAPVGRLLFRMGCLFHDGMPFAAFACSGRPAVLSSVSDELGEGSGVPRKSGERRSRELRSATHRSSRGQPRSAAFSRWDAFRYLRVLRSVGCFFTIVCLLRPLVAPPSPSCSFRFFGMLCPPFGRSGGLRWSLVCYVPCP